MELVPEAQKLQNLFQKLGIGFTSWEAWNLYQKAWNLGTQELVSEAWKLETGVSEAQKLWNWFSETRNTTQCKERVADEEGLQQLQNQPVYTRSSSSSSSSLLSCLKEDEDKSISEMESGGATTLSICYKSLSESATVISSIPEAQRAVVQTPLLNKIKG